MRADFSGEKEALQSLSHSTRGFSQLGQGVAAVCSAPACDTSSSRWRD